MTNETGFNKSNYVSTRKMAIVYNVQGMTLHNLLIGETKKSANIPMKILGHVVERPAGNKTFRYIDKEFYLSEARRLFDFNKIALHLWSSVALAEGQQQHRVEIENKVVHYRERTEELKEILLKNSASYQGNVDKQ
ncbi:hypothetical protein N9137_03210 [Pseudomonadales bacterium]|nr:hypothetical protein [Pseudomonadales bacterium]